MGNFTVLRVEPVKAAGLGGAESHQMREFYETHIDQSRSALNRVLVGRCFLGHITNVGRLMVHLRGFLVLISIGL